MIINYIENRNGFWFFSKDKIAVVTDEGEGVIEGSIDEKITRELNDKLKDFNIEDKEDFAKLKEVCGENYGVVEGCLLKSSKKLWFALNEGANMIPRPMAMILRKDSGIREFYALSLDCRDFQQACFVNNHIFELVTSKLYTAGFNLDEKGFYHNLSDEKVFEILHEAFKESNRGITFNVRIVVNFKNGKGETLKEKPIEFITNLVFNDNVLVAINPLVFSDKLSYKKLKEKILGDCYLAVDNSVGFDNKTIDFLYLKQIDLPVVLNAAKAAKEKGINIIFDGDADVCVGFGFPILKIDLREKDSGKKIARVNDILEEIKEYREELKREVKAVDEKDSVDVGEKKRAINPPIN